VIEQNFETANIHNIFNMQIFFKKYFFLYQNKIFGNSEDAPQLQNLLPQGRRKVLFSMFYICIFFVYFFWYILLPTKKAARKPAPLLFTWKI